VRRTSPVEILRAREFLLALFFVVKGLGAPVIKDKKKDKGKRIRDKQWAPFMYSP
jgi:hypothetical protein